MLSKEQKQQKLCPLSSSKTSLLRTSTYIFEKINAIDYHSSGANDIVIDGEAPEVKNKVVFTYNTVTLQLLIWYFYRFMRVDSDRGWSLLGAINHQLATVGREDMVMEQSTFMFQGSLYKTLPYLNRASEINCINLFDNGTERLFDVITVKDLIH